jgi:hypothetical protein
MSSIERQFAEAMMNIYRRAYREVKYNATVFHQMLTDHGGLETARILIFADTVSDGYAALWELRRLDLTVEALILDHPEYKSLFTDEEFDIARRRLEESRYGPALKSS